MMWKRFVVTLSLSAVIAVVFIAAYPLISRLIPLERVNPPWQLFALAAGALWSWPDTRRSDREVHGNEK